MNKYLSGIDFSNYNIHTQGHTHTKKRLQSYHFEHRLNNVQQDCYFYTFLKVSAANATVWVLHHDMILNEQGCSVMNERPGKAACVLTQRRTEREGGPRQMIQTATGHPLQVGAKVRRERDRFRELRLIALGAVAVWPTLGEINEVGRSITARSRE